MTKRLSLIIIIPLMLASCGTSNKTEPPGNPAVDDSISSRAIAFTPNTDTSLSFGTTDILCDSIYPGSGYKISLKRYDTAYYMPANTLFTMSRLADGQYLPILKDSIHSDTMLVRFADLNNDRVKDILVYDHPDPAGNWFYHLYLVNTKNNRIKKVERFAGINNPVYVPAEDLIVSYSAYNDSLNESWTYFYQIDADTIVNFGMGFPGSREGANQRGYQKRYDSVVGRIKSLRKKR